MSSTKLILNLMIKIEDINKSINCSLFNGFSLICKWNVKWHNNKLYLSKKCNSFFYTATICVYIIDNIYVIYVNEQQ